MTAMTAITPFNFAGQQVRVVEIDGEPWWVESGLYAAILGSKVPWSTLRSLVRRPS